MVSILYELSLRLLNLGRPHQHDAKTTVSNSGWYPDDRFPVGRIAWEAGCLVQTATSCSGYQLFLTGRVLSELYCMLLQNFSDAPLGEGLYEDILLLPSWASQYTCQDYVACSNVALGMARGFPTDVVVQDDLQLLRCYGNIAAHASLRMDHVEEEGYLEAQQALTRVALVVFVWANRLPLRARM